MMAKARASIRSAGLRPFPERPVDDHPCSGLWLDVDALPSALVPAAIDAIEGVYTGVIARADDVPEIWDTLALRIDVPATKTTQRSAGWRRALEYEPDLLGVPIHAKGLDALQHEAAAEGASLCAVAHGATPDEVVSAVRAEAIAVALARHDEAALDALAAHESVAAVVGGDEFASSFRLGAEGFAGLPALLGPEIGPFLLDTCRRNAGAAIDLERRLLRALEWLVDRAFRDRVTAALALGGWLPKGPRLDGEAASAVLERCPELDFAIG